MVHAICAVVLAWLAATAGSSAAQCPGPGSTDKKVVFGTPSLESGTLPAQQDVATLVDQLIFAFEFERERLWVEHPDEPITFVTCDGDRLMTRVELRRQADDLYHQGVLLYVRSLLSIRSHDSSTEREALIQYASVPVTFLGQTQAPADGLYGRRIAIGGGGDYLEAFIQPRDTDAYIAIGLGLRYADERKYDLALSNLCRAGRYLSDLASDPAVPLQPPQRAALEELRLFIDAWLANIVRDGHDLPGAETITYLTESLGGAFLLNPCIGGT